MCTCRSPMRWTLEHRTRADRPSTGGVRRSRRITASLIAPCGMDCGICAAHLRTINRCMGCVAPAGPRQHHCDVCSIKLCTKRASGSVFCFDCATYPCRRLRQLDLRYRTRYGMSMIANLDHIRDGGLDAFVDLENRRWACPTCGAPICVHDHRCYACGAQWSSDTTPES